ncbi:hypothetical protein JCM10212_000541 [Sporobolomyces blumeae]
MLRTPFVQAFARTPFSVRAFASCPAVSAPPRPSTSPASPASTASPAAGKKQNMTETLLEIVEDVAQNYTEAPVDQASVLQHLKRNQIISPQHLSPHHLLTPYLPRPRFELAYPLGPPKRFGPTHDPFVRYGLDPLSPTNAMNPFWKAEFCTTMGKIKGRGKTGLQRKSQRRVGKAIRRARSMGLVPTFGISVPGSGGERY